MVKSKELVMVKSRKHRRRRRSRNSVSMPLDLVIEIFARLPAKSLMKFKCLSKEYASIIENQRFGERFLSHSSAKPRVLFSFTTRKELFLYSATTTGALIKQDRGDYSTVASLVMTIPGEYVRVRSPSVRGLIVYTIEDNQHVICNPATKQLFHLPQNTTWKAEDFDEYLYFGYEPISNRFKVISVFTSFRTREQELWIFTVGDGVNNTWRKIQDTTLSSCSLGQYSSKPFSVCIEGVLYFKVVEDGTKTRRLVSFDLRSEKLSLIKLPCGVSDVVPGLIDFHGKLAFVDHVKLRACIWTLEDAEKHEWSSKIYELHDKIGYGATWFYVWSVAVGVCEGEIVFEPSIPYRNLSTWNCNLGNKTIKIVHIDIPSANNVGCLEHFSTIHVDNLVLL